MKLNTITRYISDIVFTGIMISISTLVFAADTCPELSTLQKAVGFVTWQGFIQLLAIGLGVTGFTYLTRGIFAKLFNMKWLQNFALYTFTFLLYFGPIGLLIFSIYIPVEYRLWGALTGALLLPGCIGLVKASFKIKINAVTWSALLMSAWGVSAIVYNSPEIGFLAVGALLSLLGFSVIVEPFCYAFGFNSKQQLLRGTIAGLLISGIYITLQISGLSDIPMVKVFKDGALWLGTFVGFTGLLVASSRWYTDTLRGYIVNQIIMIVFSLGFLSLGMLFAMHELTTLVGAFFILYLAAKPIEVKVKNQSVIGLMLLCSSGILAAVWYWIKSNPELVTQYLSL